jgi:hypothetical protein
MVTPSQKSRYYFNHLVKRAIQHSKSQPLKNGLKINNLAFLPKLITQRADVPFTVIQCNFSRLSIKTTPQSTSKALTSSFGIRRHKMTQCRSTTMSIFFKLHLRYNDTVLQYCTTVGTYCVSTGWVHI